MQIQRCGRVLLDIVRVRLPADFYVSLNDDDHAWPAIAHGLLARIAGTLESMYDLEHRGREADAATLARSLYEHAVHFAWLAAEPTPERLREWRKDDLRRRLQAEADMRKFGEGSITDELKARLEDEFNGLTGNRLILEQLAIVADQAWVSRIEVLEAGTLRSFTGQYALVYRYFSATAHPSLMGLVRVSDELGPTHFRVRMEDEYSGTGPYGMATLLFAIALSIASAVQGWPTEAEIDAALELFPARLDA